MPRQREAGGHSSGTRICRLALIGALAAAAPLCAISWSGAVGVGGSGSPSFGASPSQLPDGQQRSYYSMTLAPGQSASDTLIVTNQGNTTETLAISHSTGVTAPNSGDAYTGYFKPCSGTSCWITGLPAQVTLGPGASQTIPFTATVPPGVAAKQYLAGITIQPANLPSPVKVGGNGSGASAQAVVIHQVNIGVAVTVGDLSSMTTSVTIPNVTISMVGTTPRVNIQVDNTGQTFFNGPGSANCSAGAKKATLAFVADTILPGESATLPVNAPAFSPGDNIHCSVSIGYGQAQTAQWSGALAVPTVTPTSIIRTGPNSYATVAVKNGIPAWAYALFGVGALVLVLLLYLVVTTRRRNRTAADEAKLATGGPSPSEMATPVSGGAKD